MLILLFGELVVKLPDRPGDGRPPPPTMALDDAMMSSTQHGSVWSVSKLMFVVLSHGAALSTAEKRPATVTDHMHGVVR